MNNKIIIVSGDPNSINSEIIFKSWKKLNKKEKKNILVIANYDLMVAQFKKLNFAAKLTKIKNLNEDTKSNKINMGYAIIACCCEENYKHNVRRAINDIKLNIADIKPKIMNNIRHLLTYDRQKLINKNTRFSW